MSFSDRVDRLQRRHPVLGFPIAVCYKFFDDLGAYLAALLTYYTFISLFPVLLLASTVLSWVLRGNPGLRDRLLESALAEFPVIGDQLQAPAALDGGIAAVVIGTLGALYGALGAAQALQYAANTAWQVPRNSRPNPFKSRGRSFVLLVTVGFGLLLTTALSLYINTLISGRPAVITIRLLSVLLSMVVFLAAYQMATARTLRLSDLWVGAAVTAIGWEALKTYGATYVNTVIKHASAINGVFAFVLGMLAFIYVAALLIVFSLEIDVVRRRKLYPRALLTPFTDAVDLTRGDEKAYEGQAKAMRAKGFEAIQVTFDDSGRSARTGDDGSGETQPMPSRPIPLRGDSPRSGSTAVSEDQPSVSE
ncbi:YihY/virulence factor BrkB family protein [Yimella sp. cx-573]|nr:YihY/virulence factor BrkB family protein [Yimella sp. cx-573]